MRESTTISTTYLSFSNKSIRSRQHCLLQYISIALVVVICIFISSLSCDAFQMTTTSKDRDSSSLQMSNRRGSIMMSIPTSRLANQNNRIHSSSTTTSRCSTYTSHTGSCSQSSLFPQRSSAVLSPSRSILQMSSENQVDNNEETNCPVTKLWLSFRKLLAKFWALLIKPYQLLKSILTKSKDDTTTTTLDDKKKEEVSTTPEDVAITEVENIAVVEEEEEKIDVVAEAEQQEQVEKSVTEAVKPTVASPSISSTSRQRSSTTSTVDLTGNWTLLTDESFTSQYENYLRQLGQPMLVRTVAQTVIGSTKEETIQTDQGKMLYIRGMNVRGSWERTLQASEQIVDDDKLSSISTYHGHPVVQGHELKPMTTADGESVSVASWWEEEGTVHHSWVVGGTRYGGGDFENKRYLSDNGNILVCESTFHPREDGNGGEKANGQEREKACVTWRFLREGAIYGDSAVEFPNIFDVLKKDEKTDESDNVESEPQVIVGDIMDSVAIEDTNELLPGTDIHDVIEEAIELNSWVPPQGDRWAICAPSIDLSGKWKLITTEKWKKEYDEFLKSLGQPLIVRAGAGLIVGGTREETQQSDGGRTLDIKGINAKGVWKRSLVTSGSDFDTTMVPNSDGKYEHVQVPVVTADAEKVVAESWWANDGTTHVSWTYGVKSYGGGTYESKRYLEQNGDVYVCESTFHPNDKTRKPSYLKWRFLREGATYMP